MKSAPYPGVADQGDADTAAHPTLDTAQDGKRGSDADNFPLPSEPVLTPVFAMSPIDPRTGRWRIEEIERIALPSQVAASSRFVARMEESVMEPQVRQGAYLVIDMAQDRLPEEGSARALYAVSLRGEGLVVRLAHWDVPGRRMVLSDLRPGGLPLYVAADSPDSALIGRVAYIAQPL
jgi:hypothetical protein